MRIFRNPGFHFFLYGLAAFALLSKHEPLWICAPVGAVVGLFAWRLRKVESILESYFVEKWRAK